jgi:murein DD-endopeptidase MepM/ murein hydrolase activator NlpD
MTARRLTTLIGSIALVSTTATIVNLSGAERALAVGTAHTQKPAAATKRTPPPTPVPLPLAMLDSADARRAPLNALICMPMQLAIPFTSNIRDTTALQLHLPWGSPGDAEGRMVEDYGAYDGTSVRERFPVYDVTDGSLQMLSGHNAIDIALVSGTPLYAVTSGTVFTNHYWTIPGYPQGYAAVLISDTLRDDMGNPVAFLYGHVREFDTRNWQHVDAGTLIAKSGGDPDDPGHGISDMANVHFEVIESTRPLVAEAGTVNPHKFLANLYGYAGRVSAACSA